MPVPKLSAYALASLGRALLSPGAWLGRAIGPQLREEVILHVSSVNGCYVCSAIHEVAAKVAGLNEEQVCAVRAVATDQLDDRTRVALRYAELRTLRRLKSEPQTVEAFRQLFSPEQQREIEVLTDLFTFNNRFNNTWEAILPGATKRRARLGIGG
jgi:AhpD family alkylhydroperoxidase